LVHIVAMTTITPLLPLVGSIGFAVTYHFFVSEEYV